MPSAARASEILKDGLHLVITNRLVDLICLITFVSRDAQYKKLFRECGGLQNNGTKRNGLNQSATIFPSTF